MVLDVLSRDSGERTWRNLDLPFGHDAGPRAREALRDELAPLAEREERLVQDVLIVAGELVINAVDHGRPGLLGTIRLSWSIEDRRVCVRVTDSGYDPAFVEGVKGPEAADSVRGRGLFMVDAISESWCVRSDPVAETTEVVAYLGRA